MRATLLPSKDLAWLQCHVAVPYSCLGIPLHPGPPVPAVLRAAPLTQFQAWFPPGSCRAPAPGFASSSHALWLPASAERVPGWVGGVRAMGGDSVGIVAPSHRDLRHQQHRHSWWGLSTLVAQVAGGTGKVPRGGSSQLEGSSGLGGQSDGWANPQCPRAAAAGDEAGLPHCPVLPPCSLPQQHTHGAQLTG